MKKFITAILALAIVFGVFAGCTLVEEDDGNAVIATVNGKNILKSAYNEVYDYYYYMFVNYYGYDSETAKSQLEGMKTDILSDLIQEEVIRQKAEAAGYFNYTDEMKEEAQKLVDEDRKAYIDSFVKEYTEALKGQEIKGKNEGETDEQYFTRLATQKYHRELADNDTSEEKVLQEQLEALALEKYQEDMLKDVTVEEGDIISYYNDLSKEQEQELTTDKLFVTAYNGGSITTSSGSSKTYDRILYYRKGYSLVQHILIPFEDADAEVIKGYATTLSECDEVLEELEADLKAETDETKKAEIQAEIDKETETKNGIQAKYDEAVKSAKEKIQATTDEVYASVKDADEAKFIEVLIEKTDDSGMKTEEAAKKGYLVGPEDGMVESFSKTGQALEAGQISEPVVSDYGYHIIRCIKKLDEGKVPYENVKEEIQEQLTDEKKSEEWTKMISTWTDEAKIKKHVKRLDD